MAQPVRIISVDLQTKTETFQSDIGDKPPEQMCHHVRSPEMVRTTAKKKAMLPHVVLDARDNPEYRRKAIAGTEGGWVYQRCKTVVGSRTDDGGRCMLCNAPMRFGHEVTYPKELKRFPGIVENQLSVGAECAAKLIPPDQADIPRLAENETARKERWRRDVFGTPGICKTTVDDLIEKGKL
jgi:hypothetical protein